MAFRQFFDNLKRFGLEYFGLFYGVYRAQVAEVLDGDQGKLSLIVPATGNSVEPLIADAYPMFTFAGKGYGSYWMPDVGDSVFVMFEGGSLKRPLWNGSWYGTGEMPSAFAGKKQYASGWVSKSGSKVVIDDSAEQVTIQLTQSDGNSFIALTADGEIIMQSKKGETLFFGTDGMTIVDGVNLHTIAMDDEGLKMVTKNGNMVFMEGDGGITIMAQSDMTIASAGQVNVDAGNVNLSGTIEPGVLGNQLMSWLLSHTHVGNLGAPTPINPANAANIATILSQKVKLG